MIKEFKDFNLDQRLIKKLNTRYIITPTDIQKETIPRILKGEDVIAQSKTGTGKTLAYILPIIELLNKKSEAVLVISPTKELAIQIYSEFCYYAEEFNLKIHLLIGGESLKKQSERLREGYNIVIGVTGRILKLIENGFLKPSLIRKVILDEADFLIDLGFYNDLQRIFEITKNINQFMLFSATLSDNTKKIVDIVNSQKYSVRIDPKNRLPENIKNYFLPLFEQPREKALLELLKNINPFLCIIFVRTKKESIWLYNLLKENNYEVGCLNGDLSPSERKKEINRFRDAKIQYLVATDLASRGLDVEGVNCIINYTIPLRELDYLHRAGRTGRLNQEGDIYSLCNELDEGYLKKYAYYLDIELIPIKITKNGITEIKNYIGVKPRFNLKDKEFIEKSKKINKLKKEKTIKKESKNGIKKRRDTKRR
ncbi:MAG TPA: DEAD/DEAH box helicase [Spirochaetota bacterium]|nr:DEAD/DEAH box helicase [Spirochaetota bacterium]HOL57362.1 DEAD/DEAH box helicase [Spirochaetota bacterium]HPP04938.1 DEAD/DEAH box helicase [Spirochaetota bacterium]